MTLEEKKDFIDDFCTNYEGNSDDELCGGCPFSHEGAWCQHEGCGLSNMDDNTADRIIEVIKEYEYANHMAEQTTTVPNNPNNEPHDAIFNPKHYTQGKVECWDAMESAFGKEAVATFCKLNAFKYIWRADAKNGMEDVDKAINYLNKYKELAS